MVTTEQDKVLTAVKTAVQMEIDGRKFYLKASKECMNEVGKKLLRSLADEENIHRQKFEEIYQSISNQKSWPVTDFRPDRGRRLRTIFAHGIQKLGTSASTCASDLEAIQMAIAKESESHDFYKGQSKKSSYDTEKDFYDTLAAEERGHHLVLLDYYEYLKDPAAWFVKKEHPSLDGG